MASESYKECLVISRPTKKYGDAHGWVPQVTIFWSDTGQQHWHTIEPDIVFSEEAKAQTEGFLLARLWVDQRF
jgi:hypothetical protein